MLMFFFYCSNDSDDNDAVYDLINKNDDNDDWDVDDQDVVDFISHLQQQQ